jgi:hypothetical protein
MMAAIGGVQRGRGHLSGGLAGCASAMELTMNPLGAWPGDGATA